jgi:hypothetical protein
MRSLVILLVLLFSAQCYGQISVGGRSRADIRANKYDFNSLSNPYGAGSRFKSDGLNNSFSQHGSRYSNDSWKNPHATNAPKLHSKDAYLGRFSANRFDVDSTSNRFGQYGSKYSADSINNPYGAGNRYSSQPILVYPPR